MRRYWWWLIAVLLIMFICCSGSILLGRSLFAYPSVPDTFEETDLIGTWQATYGTALTKDTITLKADGTYQQIFQSPESDYFYTGPWNKWHLEYTADGKPKLHLENMRYCAGTIEGCEATGRGEPTIYYDFVEREYIKLTNEVILRVLGDEDSPRGIRLWNLSTDEDDGPTSFVLIDG